jgi:hypothetical protein
LERSTRATARKVTTEAVEETAKKAAAAAAIECGWLEEDGFYHIVITSSPLPTS